MQSTAHNSAQLLWRHKRLAAWIFLVNLVLAFLASFPARVSLQAILGHSLASARFVHGFDLGYFVLLLARPDFNLPAVASAAVFSTFIFFIYLLFLDGGIFAVYLGDSRLPRAEFFSNCGLFFWRMLRLALYSLPLFAIVAAIHGGIAKVSGDLSNNATNEKLGFYVNIAGKLIFILLLLLLRLWFDLAQARIVHTNQRKVFRTALRSFKTAFCSGLYFKYVGIALAGAVIAAVFIALWYHAPHQTVYINHVLLELVILTQIAVRLWLKATSARWVALHETAATAIPAVAESPDIAAATSAPVEAAPVTPQPSAEVASSETTPTPSGDEPTRREPFDPEPPM